MSLPRVPKTHLRYVDYKHHHNGKLEGSIASKVPFLENLVGAVETEFPGFKDIFFRKDPHANKTQPFTRQGGMVDNKKLGEISVSLNKLTTTSQEIAKNTSPIEELLKMLISHVDDVAVEMRVTHNLMRLLNDYNKNNYDFMRGMFRAGKENERNKEFEELVTKTKFKKTVTRQKQPFPSIAPQSSQMNTPVNPDKSLFNFDTKGIFKSVLTGGLGGVVAGLASRLGVFSAGLGGIIAMLPVLTALTKSAQEASKENGLWNKTKRGVSVYGEQMWKYGESAVSKVGDTISPYMTGENTKGTFGRNILELMGNSIGIFIRPFQKSLEEYAKGADFNGILKGWILGFAKGLLELTKSIFKLIIETPLSMFLDSGSIQKIDAKIDKLFSTDTKDAKSGDKKVEQAPPETSGDKKVEQAPPKTFEKSKLTPDKNMEDLYPEWHSKETPTPDTKAPQKIVKKDDSIEKVLKVTILEDKIQKYKYKHSDDKPQDKNSIINAPTTNNIKSNTIIAAKGTRNPLSNEILKGGVSL